MQELFWEKWVNFMAYFDEDIPLEYMEKMRAKDFDTIEQIYYTYIEALKDRIAARDVHFFLSTAQSYAPSVNIDKIWKGLPPPKRDKFWRYLQFFIKWFDEYND